jgi:hypothetical protein
MRIIGPFYLLSFAVSIGICAAYILYKVLTVLGMILAAIVLVALNRILHNG